MEALAGVIVGFLLGLVAAAIERKHRERERVRQLQEEAVHSFDETLITVAPKIPTSKMQGSLAEKSISEARSKIRAAWDRHLVLHGISEIKRGYEVLDMLLPIAAEDGRVHPLWELDFSLLGMAYGDLRSTLRSFLTRQSSPDPRLPEPSELRAIRNSKSQHLGLNRVQEHITEPG